MTDLFDSTLEKAWLDVALKNTPDALERVFLALSACVRAAWSDQRKIFCKDPEKPTRAEVTSEVSSVTAQEITNLIPGVMNLTAGPEGMTVLAHGIVFLACSGGPGGIRIGGGKTTRCWRLKDLPDGTVELEETP